MKLVAGFLLCVPLVAQDANRFHVAGVDDPAVVRRVLSEFQKAVASGDAQGVARLALYPLDVMIGADRVRVSSARQFVRLYPRVFTPCLRRVIAAADFESLFANWRGIMLGSGAVWFSVPQGGQLRITSINGPIVDEPLCKAP